MPHHPDPFVARGDAVLRIDCDECVLQHTAACGGCVVTHLLGQPSLVVVDIAEARAVRLLADAGLAPPLRHRRCTSSARRVEGRSAEDGAPGDATMGR